MSRRAACSAATCAGRARRAASSAAPGSIRSRTSVSFPRKAPGGTPSWRQASTSGSSRFQDSRGRTRVPVFGRDTTSPLAARTLTASRTTPRLARTRAAVGSCSPGWISPLHDAAADGVHDPAVQAGPRITGAGGAGGHGPLDTVVGIMPPAVRGTIGRGGSTFGLTRPADLAYSTDHLASLVRPLIPMAR